MKNKQYGLRALILEPDKSQQKGFALAAMDYCSEIKLSDNPVEALVLINSSEFDIIISELKFPTADGLEIIKHFKYQLPKALILVCSAFIDHSTSKRLKNIGVKYIFEKPVSLEKIKQKITDYSKISNINQTN